MKTKLIKAVDGNEYPIESCVQIKGDYYLIADPKKEDKSDHLCFLVDNKYYRLSAGSIIYDHRLKTYVLKTDLIIERGVIGFDENYNPIFGSFSLPLDFLEDDKVYINYKKINFLCINIDILTPLIESHIWQERLSSGIFYKRTDLPINEFYKINEVDQSYKKSLDYNSANLIKKASDFFNKNYKPVISKSISDYPQITKDYTFGLEFETIKGDIPNRISKKLGLIPLRDGSIDGLEFVTIPHSGKIGVQAILDALEELKKRTSFNKDCSLHIHIGNMPRTESFFCALTKILCVLQKEIYNYFPFYTRGGLGLKKKDFTAPFPIEEILSEMPNKINKDNLTEAFTPIFKFLSMGYNYSDYDNHLKNVKEHPSDPNNNSKWYIKARYHWVNMIPLLFGNKKTVEFRIHTPTYDPDKVINFLVLCIAIIDFAKTHETKINSGEIKPNDYNDINRILRIYLMQFGDKYEHLYLKMHKYWERRKIHQIQALKKGDFFVNENEFNNYNSFYGENQKDERDILTRKIKNLLYYNSNPVFKAGKNQINEVQRLSHSFDSEITQEFL